MAGKAAGLGIAASVAPNELTAREPELVGAVPPRAVGAVGLQAGSPRLIGNGEIPQGIVAHRAELREPALLGVDGGLREDVRATMMLVVTLVSGAT